VAHGVLHRGIGMDRRNFLRTTGAAAVAAGTAAAPARASEEQAGPAQAAPIVRSAARLLTLSSEWSPEPAGFGPERLARRIETASDGRYRIEIAHGNAEADLTYGNALRHAKLHPVFAYFAGLPFAQGLDAPAQQTWLAVGGGEMLWDELAAEHGFKPLLAGHTGASAGVWASARLETAADLARTTMHVVGLAADAMRALGATPVEVAPDELRAALADGHLQGAEWLGPLAVAAPDLQPLAQRLYEPGFHRGGMLLSLAMPIGLWEAIGAADRAVFEACAVQEYHLALADARAHALIAGQVGAPAKWPVRLAWSEEVSETFDLALAEAMEGVAASDPSAQRIHDSYQAFRHLLGEDLIA
jgi:TRAP-type mannitol/chloroaromatic compound transport system substrate-binding protein